MIDNKYNANYPYEHDTTNCSTKDYINTLGYPIIEKNFNALIFPDCIKDEIDLKDMKD